MANGTVASGAIWIRLNGVAERTEEATEEGGFTASKPACVFEIATFFCCKFEVSDSGDAIECTEPMFSLEIPIIGTIYVISWAF